MTDNYMSLVVAGSGEDIFSSSESPSIFARVPKIIIPDTCGLPPEISPSSRKSPGRSALNSYIDSEKNFETLQLNRSDSIGHNIFSIFPMSSNAESCNKYIPELFEKMKSYYKKEIISPIESLCLKFYIRFTEPQNIKLIDKDIGQISLEDQQMAIFCDAEHLWCKLNKRDKLKIIKNENNIFGYEADSYDRLMEAIQNYPTPDLYSSSLEMVEYDNFKRNDIDKGSIILAAWDKERLFNYLTRVEYVIKENCIKNWPKSRKDESIEKIKSKDLLDKFWKCSVTEYLNSEEHLNKFDNENLKILISSILFLIDELKYTDHIKFLEQILLNFYMKLSNAFPEEEGYHYECAKYLTMSESYVDAWNHIHKCNIESFYDPKDIIWMKQLKICYLSHIMKKSARYEYDTAMDYIKIGNFTKKIYEDNTLEIVDYFLEGLIHLYYYKIDDPSILIMNEINNWPVDIIFILICSAYCRISVQQHNEKCLLIISSLCLIFLKTKAYFCEEIYLINVMKTNNFPINKIDDDSILLRINILSDLGNIALIKSRILGEMIYFEQLKLLYEIKRPAYDINIYYDKYEDSILENIIKLMINDKELNFGMLIDLTKLLINRNHYSNIYIAILEWLKENNLWVSCYILINSIELALDINESCKKRLKNEIEQNHLKIQKDKRQLLDAIMSIINIIHDNKDSQTTIDNWINKCFILTRDQYLHLTNNICDLIKIKDDYPNVENCNLEKDEFIINLYKFFGLSNPNRQWIPENFINPSKYKAFSARRNRSNSAGLQKSDGSKITDKMKEAVIKSSLQGKTIEDISFFYSMTIDTVKKILK